MWITYRSNIWHSHFSYPDSCWRTSKLVLYKWVLVFPHSSHILDENFFGVQPYSYLYWLTSFHPSKICLFWTLLQTIQNLKSYKFLSTPYWNHSRTPIVYISHHFNQSMNLTLLNHPNTSMLDWIWLLTLCINSNNLECLHIWETLLCNISCGHMSDKAHSLSELFLSVASNFLCRKFISL